VTFLEGIHGYGAGTGLAGLPTRWKWTLIGLLLAAAALVGARFRRSATGATAKARHFPTPRTWRRSRGAGPDAPAAAAAAPVRGSRRGLVLSAQTPGRLRVDEIIGAATALGLDDAEARAVAGAPRRPTRRGAGAGKLNGGGR